MRCSLFSWPVVEFVRDMHNDCNTCNRRWLRWSFRRTMDRESRTYCTGRAQLHQETLSFRGSSISCFTGEWNEAKEHIMQKSLLCRSRCIVWDDQILRVEYCYVQKGRKAAYVVGWWKPHNNHTYWSHSAHPSRILLCTRTTSCRLLGWVTHRSWRVYRFDLTQSLWRSLLHNAAFSKDALSVACSNLRHI